MERYSYSAGTPAVQIFPQFPRLFKHVVDVCPQLTNLLDMAQEMLPEYISLQVAESILFVGKALRVLRNPSLTFKSQVSGSQRGSSKGFNRVDDSTSKYSLPPIGGYQGPELLPPAEADSIASMLRDLKKAPDFHKLTFERAVDSIRTIAAIHLWKVGAVLVAISTQKTFSPVVTENEMDIKVSADSQGIACLPRSTSCMIVF